MLGGSAATFFIKDSSVKNRTSVEWLCTSTTIVAEGTSVLQGWPANGTTKYDFTNTYVKAARNKDNLIELSKTGTGSAVTNDIFKIYYSLNEADFAAGTATQYTAPITDIAGNTKLYISVRYKETTYRIDTYVHITDLNADEVTDAVDMALLTCHVIGAATLDETLADINCDGTVDICDLVLLANYVK